VLDVREEAEWRAGHIADSVHTPYHDIHALPGDIDAELSVAVVCASGQRSATGASLVKAYGAKDVIHVVDGGVPLWERLGHPVERG
jgi:hydroxyacylglutathione hydrolase